MSSKELLTEDERTALTIAGELSKYLHRICMSGWEKSSEPEEARRVAEHDWNETAAAIHNIQNRIMAQAAARAYPDRYRLLGHRIEDQ